jgi:hypothetical protein
MHPKKVIKITDDEAEYSFQVHLEKKRIDLILKKAFLSPVELIIGMNSVPDIVQIRFYKALQLLIREHQTTRPDSQ